MAERPLTPDEAALWARVLETVRPIRVKKPVKLPPSSSAASPAKAGVQPVNTGNKTPRSNTSANVTGPRPSPGKHKGEAATLKGNPVDLAKMLKAGLDAPPSKKRALSPSLSAVPKPSGGKESATLDGSWDRQLSRGAIAPDRAIDLHGHSLSTAYALLDTALERAIREGDRVILLVTGKPPRAESERPHARGAIRAAVGDWLAGSRHAAAIAAVRGAHPRHGGAGALYIILRKGAAHRNY